ncbi:MAG: hypothetical protein JOY66_16870 [Acetobacteraceae bacterium]|nr:hypothetical protein [Acetobacteraceae bacterium]
MRGHGSRRGTWRRAALALGAIGLLAAAASTPAQARVGVFFGFGVPAFYYPPPVYYPLPPVFYAPPVAYTAPPAFFAPPVGGQGFGPGTRVGSCDAGSYVCPLERPLAQGATCWCPTNRGGRAYGRAG